MALRQGLGTGRLNIYQADEMFPHPSLDSISLGCNIMFRFQDYPTRLEVEIEKEAIMAQLLNIKTTLCYFGNWIRRSRTTCKNLNAQMFVSKRRCRQVVSSN